MGARLLSSLRYITESWLVDIFEAAEVACGTADGAAQVYEGGRMRYFKTRLFICDHSVCH